MGKDFQNDNLPEARFATLLQQWVSAIVPKLKSTGSIYCFMGYEYFDLLKAELSKYLTFRRELIWHYQARGSKVTVKNYLPELDKILFFTKSSNYTFNVLRTKPSRHTIERYAKSTDVEGFVRYEKLPPSLKKKWKSKEQYTKSGRWNIYSGKPLGNLLIVPRVKVGHPEAKFDKHPTQKPEKLIEIFVKVSSNEGDLVGDFFAGSGTTPVVAKRLRRKYCGIEIEKKFYNIAMERLKATPTYESLF